MQDVLIDSFVEIDAPIRTLVDLWLSDCENRNLAAGTLRFYRLKVVFLIAKYGDRKPSDLSTARLKLLVSDLRNLRGWGIGQTNHFITTIKVFYAWLEREGLIEKNPARMLKKLKAPERLPKSLQVEEVEALLAACNPGFCGQREKTMILVMLDTGCRIGELAGMSLDDVDLATGQIRLFGKGRKERLVPFEVTTRKSLLRWIAVRSTNANSDALWITTLGERLTVWHIRHRLQQLAKKAGVENFTPHRLRHTAATYFLQSGGSASMLQRMLGHTSPTMTNRYVHLVDSDVKAAHKVASPVERLHKKSG